MNKILAAGLAAASIGAVAIVFAGLAGTEEAHSTPAVVKGDRLDAKPYGPACSQAGWPYYEASCLRNLAAPTRQVRPVRIVSTDRR